MKFTDFWLLSLLNIAFSEKNGFNVEPNLEQCHKVDEEHEKQKEGCHQHVKNHLRNFESKSELIHDLDPATEIGD